MPPNARRSQALRIASWALGGVAVALSLVLIAAACALIFLGSASGHAYAIQKLNTLLKDAMTGRLEIQGFRNVGLAGAEGVNLIIFDADGKRVIEVAEARVELDVPGLLLNLVGSGPLRIKVPKVSAAHAVLRLIDDGNGLPTFVGAFNPRVPTPAAEGTSRATLVELEQIRLDHVWVHGQLRSVPALDVDLLAMRGSLSVEEEQTVILLKDFGLKARGVPVIENAAGRVFSRLLIATPTKKRGRSNDTPDLVVSLTFNGWLTEPSASGGGRSPVQLDAKLNGASLIATAKIAPLGRALMQRLAPRVRLAEDSELTLSVNGKLPSLDVEATLLSGPASVRIGGHIKDVDPLKGELEITARSIDAAAIDPDAPSSRVDFDLTSSFFASAAELQANYKIDVLSSEVSAISLPPTAIHGALRYGFESQSLKLEGALLLHEPGAPTSIQYTFQAPQGNLGLTAHSELTQPPRLALFVPGLTAKGSIDVAGSLNVETKHLMLEANAQLSGVRFAGGSSGPKPAIEHANIRLKAEGAFTNPNLSGLLSANNIEAGGQHLSTARVQVGGTPGALSVVASVTAVDGRTLRTSAKVGLTDGVELRQLRATYTDLPLVLTGRAAQLSIRGGRVSVVQAELAGAGELRLSGAFANSLERLDFESKQLDLSRLLATFTRERWLRAAVLNVSAKYERRGTGASGSLTGTISGIKVDRVQDGSVQLGIQLESGLLSGPIEVKLGENASVVASLDHVGPVAQVIDRGSIRDLRGRLHAEGRLPLARLLGLLGPDALPLDSAHGTLTFELDASAKHLGVPDINLRARTEELSLVGRRLSTDTIVTAAEAREAQPWALQGLDLDVSLSTNGPEGSKLGGRLFDLRGDVATFELLSRAELHPTKLPDLPTLPWEARVHMPRRDLEHLPAALKLPGWAGTLSGALEARGTLLDPAVSLALRAENLKSSEFGAKKTTLPPLDVNLAGNYQASRGTLRIEARSQDNARAIAAAEWQGSPLAMTQIGQTETSPITGHMNLDLNEFPIDILPTLRARGLSGRLSGHAALKDFGRAAALSADIRAVALKTGDIKGLSVSAKLAQQGSALLLKVSLAQPSGTSMLSFRSGVLWGDRLLPQVAQPMSAELDLRQLDLEAFQPLLIDRVTDLGGKLDGKIQVDLGEANPMARGWLRLNDGSFSVPAIGQRLDHIHADLSLTPNRLLLRELTAHGITGKLTAAGHANFAGIEPTYAELGVSINKNEKIPVTLEGMTVGDVWGRVAARYQPGRGNADSVLEVAIPKLHVELAATPPNTVQSMDPAEGVRIGMAFPDRFVTLPLQPLLHETDTATASNMMIRVLLGDDVTIIKGTDLKAKLSGQLDVQSAPGTRISGQIKVLSGTLDVSGKQFQIERGTVTFRPEEDAANPTIVATARWDSPSQYSVFAEYRGAVDNGKLTLRSEPPLAEDEILTLILFGTPDGNVGSGGGASDASAAAGLVAGTATKGLNRALSKVSDLDVSARVDTSSGASRPELVVQISPRVAARVTQALGEPSAGQSPDRTFLTLDFRLFRKWSLAAQVGNQGASSLDMVWRHRY